MSNRNMLFGRPRNCRYCGNGFYGLGHVVDYAQQLGHWEITDLQAEQANREPIFDALNQYDPLGYYHFGHGNENIVTGDAEQPVFTTTDCSILANRIVYFLSCLTAVNLGPAIINNGGKAYAGFNITWTWMSASGTDGDPYDDPYAHGFYESANELWIALLDQHTVQEAYQQSVEKYNEWIEYWIASGDTYAAEAIQWLAWDRDGLVALGDLNAKIFTCADATTKEECLASGCFWYSNGCHSTLPENIRDIREVAILVPPGYASAENIQYLPQVYEGFAFAVTYTVRNTGGQNLIWGHIRDLGTGEIVDGSYWQQILDYNETITIETEFPPITRDMNLQIEIGH